MFSMTFLTSATGICCTRGPLRAIRFARASLLNSSMMFGLRENFLKKERKIIDFLKIKGSLVSIGVKISS